MSTKDNVTGVDADLATPVGEHECATCKRCATTYAIVHPACPKCAERDRVEAELSRLREQRDATMRSYDSCIRTLEKAVETAEAAEARCARLQQALREIEEYRYPLNGTLEAIVAMKALAREALAGPDTPAEEEA